MPSIEKSPLLKNSKFIFGKKEPVSEIKEKLELSSEIEPDPPSPEPEPADPPSPEPEPAEPVLQLVDGVWKRLFVRVNQELEYKSKNYLGNEPPDW